MNYEFKDFIGTYTDLFPEGYCKHMIDQFVHHRDSGLTVNRQNGEGARRSIKDDLSLVHDSRRITFEPFQDMNASDIFWKGLQECFKLYENQ